ncbi:uncharacterized protein LOC142351247 isoform X2 [Convolutriloba macropyga]|uniref:uncharacterized protein LOC142351247 isoform X2 n=1 Tax=Convolutriloba macropyga TaxID=536237 RepID=UPI003F527DF5
MMLPLYSIVEIFIVGFLTRNAICTSSAFSTFNTDAYIEIETTNNLASANLDNIQVTLRTRHRHGVILYMKGADCFFTMEMDTGGCFVIKSSAFTNDKITFSCNLIDGEVKEINLDILTSTMELRIAGSLFQEIVYSGSSFDRQCVSKVYVGGVNTSDVTTEDFPSGQPESMDGCMGDVRINGDLMPFHTSADNGNGYSYIQQSGFVTLNICIDSNTCNTLPADETCNAGQCSVNNTGWRNFNCDCANTGYEGQFCEIDIDECETDPCVRGQCNNLVNDFSCSCPSGFEGRTCSEDIDECLICDDPNEDTPCNGVCTNRANCSNSVGSFTCFCDDFWLGDVCNEATTCAGSPCGGNGQSCSDKSGPETDGRQFECVCKNGFMGTTCDEIDYCANEDCNGRGGCSNTGDAFICTCNQGWEGSTCQTDIDECTPLSPCTRENADQDCENKTPDQGSYDCHCKFGWTLPNCDSIVDFCEDEPCQNNATCASEDFLGPNCTCIPGFEGDRCETNIDECVDNECKSESTCVDGIDGYTCDCAQTGFKGTFCDEECFNASACSNSGSCLFNSTLDEFYCDCDSAFGGSLCTDELSVPDDDDNSLSTAGAALLAIFIIIVVILLILAVILTVKYFNNTKISSGSFSPKKEENADNMRAKPSDFPEFHIPRAKLERLI